MDDGMISGWVERVPRGGKHPQMSSGVNVDNYDDDVWDIKKKPHVRKDV